MSQEFRGLTSEERAALESGLSLASRLGDAAPPLTAAHVQDLYDTLSSQYPEYGEGIIAAGLAFGELLAQKVPLEWVRVKDEFGEETVLAIPDLKIFCSPVSMIQKRVRESARVSITDLCHAMASELQRMADSGEYDSRP
jgi:hypothetical protein